MTWTPDTRQRLAKATRFFARLTSFDMECPHCGYVYQVRTGRKDKNWDPITARFDCTQAGCERRYVLGVLAWPVSTGGHHTASMPPEDQVPRPYQLAQMRKEGGGWWLPVEERIKYQKPLETNLTTEEDRPTREDEEE